MADIFASRSRMRATASVALALALSACSLTPERADVIEPVPLQASTQLDELLSSLHEFISASPEQRSALYFDALAAERTPGNRLRLALLQGWPDHPHSRPADALRLADQVMDDETLDTDVRDVARVLRGTGPAAPEPDLDAQLQPGTLPACSIHWRICGSCASSSVRSFT